jgi:hypothetical protein
MLWVIPPHRVVGRPARKIEKPDYRMISVWEKRITTVTAVPVLLVTVSPNQVAVSQRAASSVLFHTRDRIGIEVAPNDFQARHRCGSAPSSLAWICGARGQMADASANAARKSVRAVELGVSERMPYRDITELNAQGARRSMASLQTSFGLSGDG